MGIWLSLTLSQFTSRHLEQLHARPGFSTVGQDSLGRLLPDIWWVLGWVHPPNWSLQTQFKVTRVLCRLQMSSTSLQKQLKNRGSLRSPVLSNALPIFLYKQPLNVISTGGPPYLLGICRFDCRIWSTWIVSLHWDLRGLPRHDWLWLPVASGRSSEAREVARVIHASQKVPFRSWWEAFWSLLT